MRKHKKPLHAGVVFFISDLKISCLQLIQDIPNALPECIPSYLIIIRRLSCDTNPPGRWSFHYTQDRCPELAWEEMVSVACCCIYIRDTVFFHQSVDVHSMQHKDDPGSFFYHKRIIYLLHDVVLIQCFEMFLVPFVLFLFSGIYVIYITINQSGKDRAKLRPADSIIWIEILFWCATIRLHTHDMEVTWCFDIELHIFRQRTDISEIITSFSICIWIDVNDLDGEVGYHFCQIFSEYSLIQICAADRTERGDSESICPAERISDFLTIGRIRDIAERCRSMFTSRTTRIVIITIRQIYAYFIRARQTARQGTIILQQSSSAASAASRSRNPRSWYFLQIKRLAGKYRLHILAR